MNLRPYNFSDRSACIKIFESNIPKYFNRSEIDGFESFLDDLPGPYFVLENDVSEVVGCGGYAVKLPTASADLCWGMVHQACHGIGLGDFLLLERLKHIQANSEIQVICLNTCQHTTGFFERLGFVIEDVTPDGYAPGLDRCEMRFVIDRA